MGTSIWDRPRGRKVALKACWIAPLLALATAAAWIVSSYSGLFKHCSDTPCGMVQIVLFLSGITPLVLPLAGPVFIWRWKNSGKAIAGPFLVLWSVWLFLAGSALVSSWVLYSFMLA